MTIPAECKKARVPAECEKGAASRDGSSTLGAGGAIDEAQLVLRPDPHPAASVRVSTEVPSPGLHPGVSMCWDVLLSTSCPAPMDSMHAATTATCCTAGTHCCAGIFLGRGSSVLQPIPASYILYLLPGSRHGAISAFFLLVLRTIFGREVSETFFCRLT